MIVTCDQNGIQLAMDIIKKGGLVVFPTDTVYGLGCDPRNSKAIESIFRVKKRKESKQLPLLGFSKEDISKIVYIDEMSDKIANRFWPGPVTLILRLKDGEIRKSMNLDNKIAVRVPNHPCTLSILEECRILVGTSANFSGNPSFSDPKKVLESFSGFDLFVDGGIISHSNESTIVEIDEGKMKIIRHGKIKKSELLALF